MKKARKYTLYIISVILILLILRVLVSRYVVTPGGGKWGEPYNDVQVMLYTPESHYKKGDWIQLYVRFRNVGEETRQFNPKSFSYGLSLSIFFEAIFDGMDDWAIEDEEIVIEPGKTTEDYSFVSLGTKQSRAGIYTFTGSLRYNEMGVYKFHPLKVIVW